MQTATRETIFLNFDPQSAKAQELLHQLKESNEFELMGTTRYPVDLSIDPDFKSKPLYSIDEYIDSLAKIVGKRFGMNDIRDAK